MRHDRTIWRHAPRLVAVAVMLGEAAVAGSFAWIVIQSLSLGHVGNRPMGSVLYLTGAGFAGGWLFCATALALYPRPQTWEWAMASQWLVGGPLLFLALMTALGRNFILAEVLGLVLIPPLTVVILLALPATRAACGRTGQQTRPHVSGPPKLSAGERNVNLLLRFLLELAVYGAVCYVGFTRLPNLAAKLAVGLGGPALLAVLWALFASPRARRPLHGRPLVAFEIAWFGAGALALAVTGQAVAAILLAVLYAVNVAFLRAWSR